MPASRFCQQCQLRHTQYASRPFCFSCAREKGLLPPYRYRRKESVMPRGHYPRHEIETSKAERARQEKQVREIERRQLEQQREERLQAERMAALTPAAKVEIAPSAVCIDGIEYEVVFSGGSLDDMARYRV